MNLVISGAFLIVCSSAY